MKLDGKVAIVTGGGRGIGRAIVLSLAREGADVVVDDIDLETANAVADEVRTLGRKALVIKADVSNLKEVNQMVKKTLDTFGKIDILVNNAGYLAPPRSGPGDFRKDKEEEWDKMLNVNLKGVIYCCKPVVKHMRERMSGKIINISSDAGKIGARDIVYSASKGGVIAFTKALAKQLAPYGINVNSVSPGQIDTPMLKVYKKDYVEKNYIPKIPMGRLGKPEEVAALVTFLASDDSSYITGQIISPDGGLAMT